MVISENRSLRDRSKLSCKHLEVSDFGTYSVDFDGVARVVALLKCNECGAYLRLDGTQIPSDKVISREAFRREKMRTVIAHIDPELYERLTDLAISETGEKDLTKIMDEVLALGLKHYHMKLKTTRRS